MAGLLFYLVNPALRQLRRGASTSKTPGARYQRAFENYLIESKTARSRTPVEKH
jgi:hypothetical protein